MSLGGPHTRPLPGSAEEELLRDFRSGGFAVRFADEDAVHRILEPTQMGPSTVGLVVIRNRGIVYAEFDRIVFPWWGRGRDSHEYHVALSRLMVAVDEGRRK